MMSFIQRLWGIQDRASFDREVSAGITGFLACAYIVIVNPVILSQTGMSFSALVTSTVLVCVASTLLMGFYGKNPMIVAPGMGLNAYFTYSVVKGMGVSPEVALGCVFWAGIVFFILSATPIREGIVRTLPQGIRPALSAGIGLFITLIGLINAGFIQGGKGTPLSLGPVNAVMLTFLIGLVITAFLLVKKNHLAFIIGPVLTALLSYPIGRWYGDASYLAPGTATLNAFNGIVAWPDFSLLFSLDIKGAFQVSLIPVILAVVFTDLFDSLSTFTGVAQVSGLLDKDGQPRNLRQSLITDAFATFFASLMGSSAGTAYIESAAAVQSGGRTGLTAVVAGLCFLPLLFFSPLLSMIPVVATAPVLVLVGVFMMGGVTQVNWTKLDESIPAFLAMVLIPFTYSISQGIIWGIFSFTLIKVLMGRMSEIKGTLIFLNILCLVALLGSAH